VVVEGAVLAVARREVVAMRCPSLISERTCFPPQSLWSSCSSACSECPGCDATVLRELITSEMGLGADAGEARHSDSVGHGIS